MTEPSSSESGTTQRTWLSRSLTELLDTHYGGHRHAGAPLPHFDVLIVGSGYGGAVAAASLAGCSTPDGKRALRIGVLERGEEYLPGTFPSQFSELPGHVRLSLPGETSPKGTRSGLFDVRVGADIVSVVANGLGGGSLINAGVMLRPHEDVLHEPRWPAEIRDTRGALDRFYDHVERWLGARSAGRPNTVDRTGSIPPKLEAMRGIGGAAVPITVAIGPNQRSSAGVAMKACIGCGDCALGCNHGAKISVDVNLLAHAENEGVEIYTGAMVLWVEKSETGWLIVVNHTEPALRHRQGVPFRIAADKVILAAGTFGSTEILLRSRQRGLGTSRLVGKRFSGNGDLFAAAYDTRRYVNALATETLLPDQRNVGPTITAAIDCRRGDPQRDLSIQELAVPGPLRRLFEEIFTSGRTLHSLAERDRTCHTRQAPDRNAVDPDAFRRTLPLALIGRDSANGKMVLNSKRDDAEGDGVVDVKWRGLTRDRRFDDHHDDAQRLLTESGCGGTLLPNPAWKLQPDAAAHVLGIRRGPLLTVHPLGGCVMATTPDRAPSTISARCSGAITTDGRRCTRISSFSTARSCQPHSASTPH
jgi:cholesterol oxidase